MPSPTVLLDTFEKKVNTVTGNKYSCSFTFIVTVDKNTERKTMPLSAVESAKADYVKAVCQHPAFKVNVCQTKKALIEIMKSRLDVMPFNVMVKLVSVKQGPFAFEFCASTQASLSAAGVLAAPRAVVSSTTLSALNAAQVRAVLEYLNVEDINGATVDSARTKLKAFLEKKIQTNGFFPFVVTNNHLPVARPPPKVCRKMGANGPCNKAILDDRTYCTGVGHHVCQVLLDARDNFTRERDSYGEFLAANILDECVSFSVNPLQPVKCESYFDRGFQHRSNYDVYMKNRNYLSILRAPLGVFLSKENPAIADQKQRAKVLAIMYLRQLESPKPSNIIVLLDGHGALLLLVMRYIWKGSGKNKEILNAVIFKWPDTNAVVTKWHKLMFPCPTIHCSGMDVLQLIETLEADGLAPVSYLNFCGFWGQLPSVVEFLDSLFNTSKNQMSTAVPTDLASSSSRCILLSFSVARGAKKEEGNFKECMERPDCPWVAARFTGCGRDNVFVTYFITTKKSSAKHSFSPRKHLNWTLQNDATGQSIRKYLK